MRIINQLIKGYTDYQDCDALQRQIHRAVSLGQAPDTLIVSQFDSVYTAGRATKPEVIKDKNLNVVETDRGGSITWHGPGQLVIYPIVKLLDPTNSIGYIRAVEAGVLGFLRNNYNLPVELVNGRAGIWYKEDGEPDKKICAIGLKIAQGATMHGLALNINPDMSLAFSGIVPCGLDDAWVCTMHDFGINQSIEQIADGLVTYLCEALKDVVERGDELLQISYQPYPIC